MTKPDGSFFPTSYFMICGHDSKVRILENNKKGHLLKANALKLTDN